jgi:dCMP deaminase
MSDQRWLKECLHDLRRSEDPSTQVAALIVIGAGMDGEWVLAQAVNGLPPGVRPDQDRLERPRKYLFFEHAERAAIYAAARDGHSLEGATLYVTSEPTAFPPCADCARAIISAGITRVVQRPYSGDWARWAESCNAALDMLREAGVAYDLVSL